MGDLPMSILLHNELMAIKNNDTCTPWTIQNGKAIQCAGQQLMKILPAQKQLQWQANGQVYTLTYDQVDTLAYWIDQMGCAATMYAAMMDKVAFKKLYPPTNATVSFFPNQAQQEVCRACINCGILLPEKYIAMDHQRPQSGGEVEAMAKVLRVLGCTRAGPKGTKCTQLSNAIAAGMTRKDTNGDPLPLGHVAISIFMDGRGLTTPVVPKAMRGAAPALTSTLDDRYSLNPQGMLFLSLFNKLCFNAPSNAQMSTRAMHSLCNLRPLCANCNGVLGKKGKKYP